MVGHTLALLLARDRLRVALVSAPRPASGIPDVRAYALNTAARDLLRTAMEVEGFTVNDDEWWHYDWAEWRRYPIMDVPLEAVTAR